MSFRRRQENQADDASPKPLGASMQQGTTGTNHGKGNAPDINSSMHQGSRPGASGIYKQTIGQTMKQGGRKTKG